MDLNNHRRVVTGDQSVSSPGRDRRTVPSPGRDRRPNGKTARLQQQTGDHLNSPGIPQQELGDLKKSMDLDMNWTSHCGASFFAEEAKKRRSAKEFALDRPTSRARSAVQFLLLAPRFEAVVLEDF